MKTETAITSFTKAVTVILVLGACATPKTYVAFTDWDYDGNNNIERNEFIQAYTQLKYFKKWADNRASISYPEFQHDVFGSLDKDRDGKLSETEFAPKIKGFYFGLFHDQFKSWDDNGNDSIELIEFENHVAKSDFSPTWDTNGDKSISEPEMAGGMFYVCDMTGDGKISDMELEIWRVNRR